MKKAIGVDVGGSHISAAIVDLNTGAVLPGTLRTRHMDTNRPAGVVLDEWVETILDAAGEEHRPEICGIGFSMPGPFDYERGVSGIHDQNKYELFFGMAVKQSLLNRLHKHLILTLDQVQFINDAQGFLVGAVWEKGWQSKKVIGLTLGTGFGSAFYDCAPESCRDGALWCAPFRGGIAEDFVSTRWFVNTYNARSDRPVRNVKEIADLYAESETARAVFREFGRNLGEVLIPVLQDFQPDGLILGGNILRSYALFEEPFLEFLSQNGFQPEIALTFDTEANAIRGAVQLYAADNDAGKFRSFRKTQQHLMPLKKEPVELGKYDIYPAFPLGDGLIDTDWTNLATWLAGHSRVVIEGYSGVLWDHFAQRLNEEFCRMGVKVNWYCQEAALKEEAAIDDMIGPYLGGDDPIFGKLFPGNLGDFFEKEKLTRIRPEEGTLSIIYGPGAILSGWDAPVVYVDVPKNEIQFRSRAGILKNLGAGRVQPPKQQYKRWFFVEWPVLNRHKQALLPMIELLIDEQRIATASWMRGEDFRSALDRMAAHAFRVRPWFEPGPWGGQWIKEHIPGLNQEVVNYAWSFELITPENGLIVESDGNVLEFSFDFLMYRRHEEVLGRAAGRFGYEFPIRFDFLDTFDGGNLSVQCHPDTEYIRGEFGENFTQDETYYILNAGREAVVYLGFQEGVDPVEFRQALEESRRDLKEIDIEQFVQTHPAKKHDLFLIPNGTIHCSGRDNLVLEISATPYIYTFKMYDWLRLDLDGNPRPLNIERAFKNLNFDRQGEKVREELISHPAVIRQGADWKLVHLPTHPDHFYDVHRLEFDDQVEVETENNCHVLSLVEGTHIIVRTGQSEQRINYAETFVVPAAAGRYRLVNEGESAAKVVKAFVKKERLEL